ncbi:MlaD family protein [Flaviaesturariibacter amylovorans]|uniref:MlaD family protein n=1 Tax=Flaviaesturariibacter amylovorans TaxID=1084520 RepID=A0ABP8GW13_9BACT
MKISNEAKVGILAIAAILVLVLGFNFLKGKKVFGKSPVLYAEFSNLGALQKSNPVKINGLDIGTAYDFRPKDKEVSAVIVEIHLTRDVVIPKDSKAFIEGNPLGISSIVISKGQSNAFLGSGDTLRTVPTGGLLADLREQVAPTMQRINTTLDTLTRAISSVNSIFDPVTNRNLQTMIANLAVSSAGLQRILSDQTGALAQSLNNMNSVTGNLARNNEAITHTIRNVETTTSNLANAHIKEAVAALENTINELKGAAGGLRTTMDKLQSPNGTLGAMMNDRKLYDQLNRVALSLEILLDDVRIHPKRYVNISVFGGKGKTDPLTSPAAKDTIPVKR